jgi:peroxiredoxin
MKKTILYVLAIMAISMITVFTANADHHETAETGKAAPDFTLTDHEGNTHSLSDFEGKVVVLEWINFDCPFVKKHYDSSNMQKLQQYYTAKDVVWLAINSSAEGMQGNFSNDEIAKRIQESNAAMTAYLIDTDGKVGHMYGAKTTPNMYIVDAEGNLAYAGAIDDNPAADPAVISGSKNYVQENLELIMAGKPVKMSKSKPYGCSVKYAKK